MSPFDFWQLLIGGLNPEEAKVVRRVGATILFRGWLTIFSIMAMGGFAWLGWAGFVRADEVDKKIAATVQQQSAEMSRQASAIQQLASAQTEQTLALLTVAITDGLVKMCHAPKGETKAIYRHQVDEAQVRYYKLMGRYYPEHSCADL